MAVSGIARAFGLLGLCALTVDGFGTRALSSGLATSARPHQRLDGRSRGRTTTPGLGRDRHHGIRMMAAAQTPKDEDRPPRVLIVANRLPVVAYRDGGEVGEKMMSSFYSKLQGQQVGRVDGRR